MIDLSLSGIIALLVDIGLFPVIGLAAIVWLAALLYKRFRGGSAAVSSPEPEYKSHIVYHGYVYDVENCEWFHDGKRVYYDQLPEQVRYDYETDDFPI